MVQLPQYNCYLSHRNAILTAKKRKWPYVFILEDDAYPIRGVRDEIDRHLKELPEDCNAFQLGYICLWNARKSDGLFHRAYKSYGAHAYVVFSKAYDDFVRMLDKAPEGDGAFHSIQENILPKETFFTPRKNLFIQYTEGRGMNNSAGYVYLVEHEIKYVNGHVSIPWDKSIPEENAVMLGFPPMEEIETGKTPERFNILKQDNPLTFATVNAGTNTFTNITIKTILQFHPRAKVFVVDVPKDENERFTHIDEDTEKNVEVVQGIGWNDLNLPTIDLSHAECLSKMEKSMAIQKFHGKDSIEVLPTGDYQHPANIQFAIDTLNDNFILVDSDAPLVFPAQTLNDPRFVTVAQEQQWDYVHMDRLRPLLHPGIPRHRFDPCIQFLNVKMMKEHGLEYFNPDMLEGNLDMAGWFKNPSYNGQESLFFWTGSLFHRNVMRKRLPVKPIRSSWYVDHFGGGTWGDKGERNRVFISKYKHLFKNQEALLDKMA